MSKEETQQQDKLGESGADERAIPKPHHSPAGEWLSLVWLLLLFVFIRSVVAQPFVIPSGSMIPTLLIGDHVFVAQSAFDIGIHIPYIGPDKKLIPVGEPKRGEPIVFINPHKKSFADQFYIKRLIGLPGDKILIRAGEIIRINDEEVELREATREEIAEMAPDYEHFEEAFSLYREKLPGNKLEHWVRRDNYVVERLPMYLRTFKEITGKDCGEVGVLYEGNTLPSDHPYQQIASQHQYYMSANYPCEFTVPEGKYFMVGDNRDQSSDSRAWGFVPRENLVGKALFIWAPWINCDEALGKSCSTLETFMRWPLFRSERFGLRIR